jgi:hypothetical protein
MFTLSPRGRGWGEGEMLPSFHTFPLQRGARGDLQSLLPFQAQFHRKEMKIAFSF